jgi:adenylate cyclase
MSENPEAIKDLPENKEMTVLFSDVRGFTTISEGLAPEELSELMNAFLSPLTRVIHERGGTIDKYMGDAIMAFWGAPLPDEAHARHAMDAGMAMLKEAERISETFKERGWPELRIGCGLNTGSMSVGNMGSEFRRAYTVLGDAVNLGARCESITKQYGVLFVVAENTQAAAPDYTYRELDLVKVKGKNQPVALFEPIALTDELDDEQKQELAAYHQALTLYRQQKWDEAEQILTKLKRQHDNKMIYDIYLSRLTNFRANPPEKDWDGVFVSTSK